MNEKIIENWNAIIQPDDDVYILGDIVLSDINSGIAALKQLKGNIHIIRGNHDSESRLTLYKDCQNVVEVCDGKFLKVGKQTFFLSHYPCLTSNFDADKPLNRRIDKGLIYHVEMDAHGCKPVSAEQIINEIKEKIQ